MTQHLPITTALIDRLLGDPPFALDQKEKTKQMTPALAELTEYHRQHCEPYGAMLRAYGYRDADHPGQLPFLPVRLFKQMTLCSVPDESVFKVLTSSGTTSQVPSRIYLDRDTAGLQTRVLVKIMQDFLGKKRLPMLMVDHPGVIRDRSSFSARGAGILGMQTFGHSQTYLLDDDQQIDFNALDAFTKKFADTPVFIFGFTFMIWQYLVRALESQDKKLQLKNSVLVHSGGWKTLQEQAVDNSVFKARLAAATGITRVHNFYGMVEQVGSVFVACESDHLHAPTFADVIVRDPLDWHALPVGQEGIIEVISLIPHSYPGHRLLTEDMGTLLGEDDCPCGRKGRYFEIKGRLKQAELRGCSDTHGAEVAGGAK